MGGARKRVIVVVGTRPEAIKMAPVVRCLEASATLRPTLVSTGQHRELMDDVLGSLGLRPEHELAVMTQAQSPNEVLARVVERLHSLLNADPPACVLVQGDTTTVLGAALAAYHLRIPVGHVEAGLRTYDHDNPFPEEANRQLVDRLSRFCFAPTEVAREQLISERIDARRVTVTGNTVIDALLWARGKSTMRLEPDTVLVTLHRRESFDGALDEILAGLGAFLERAPAARCFWPVHPNPNVVAAAARAFDGHPRVTLAKPLGYVDFAGALASARFVLTDSGGLQEEGPSLGKTVLVARDRTERPEALGGRNRLVGRTREAVTASLTRAWEEPPWDGPIPAPSPFGDGEAARRIVEHLERELS